MEQGGDGGDQQRALSGRQSVQGPHPPRDQFDVRCGRFIGQGFPLGKQRERFGRKPQQMVEEQQIVGKTLGGFVRIDDDQPGPVIGARQQGQRERGRRAVQAGQAGPVRCAAQGVPHGQEKLIP